MKKIQWYLDRNLGEVVSNDPITLKLFFEPSGRVGAEHPYNTSYKENRCVCCGSKDRITRHHVVPYCFRRYFPEKMKKHKLHDVLPLCISCHNLYEEKASELKKRYSEEMNIPLEGTGIRLEKSYYKVRAAAFALVGHFDKLPENRKQELTSILKEFFNREVTREDMVLATKLKPYTYDETYRTFGQAVVEKIENIEEFIIKWRSHFVKSMQPQYLPEHWDVDSNL
jgi:hypothetical protein